MSKDAEEGSGQHEGHCVDGRDKPPHPLSSSKPLSQSRAPTGVGMLLCHLMDE